jgi:hypothetical protein
MGPHARLFTPPNAQRIFQGFDFKGVGRQLLASNLSCEVSNPSLTPNYLNSIITTSNTCQSYQSRLISLREHMKVMLFPVARLRH